MPEKGDKKHGHRCHGGNFDDMKKKLEREQDRNKNLTNENKILKDALRRSNEDPSKWKDRALNPGKK